ncbi:MAG: DNA gyrase subunit A [Patescibacteria group bacterium]
MSGKNNKSDKNKSNIPEKPVGWQVIPAGIVKEMQDAYLDYSMSVIVSRALPDVRDGLKPVHRRILYTMHGLGLHGGSKFKKSAVVVGDVLGKYHPHGDSSVYDAMVKMAQDFSARYPLVAGQGNFGSIDGDSAAAFRYTEAKMSRLASEMLKDIEKETVEYADNYSGELKEPTVLPAAIPNLLLNGTFGIAVGMATKIPPHNLTEVAEALKVLADNPDLAAEDLTKYITGPDFPTGGLVFNKKDLVHAYSTGRGGVTVRGEAEIIETKTGGHQIIISSIPYQVNKADMIIKMADLVRNKKIDGIRDIRDESTKDIRVVIDLKNGAQPQKMLNVIYKHTDLETTFHYNMLALSGGVPKLMPLKVILEEFLLHRREVVVNRTRFDLKKAEAREHILLGLKKALDHIDAIIKTIKKSKDTAEAHKRLQQEFKLSDLQATAILEMRLQKLAGLERKKIEEELKEKQQLIKELKAILASPQKITTIIKDELQEAIDKYGDDRRTKVIPGGVKTINPEDLVPEKDNVLVLTEGGYIKRTDPSEFRQQKRGGTGVIDLNVKEEDFVRIFLTANTHSDLLFFTDKGKVYQMKMYDLPECKRATRGKSIVNYLALEADEKVTSVLSLDKDTKWNQLALVMVTKFGVVKKVQADNFKDVRRSGLIAIHLGDKDELLSVRLVGKGDSIILATIAGQSIRFKESDLRSMGRTAAGVRGIKLSKDDYVVGADRVEKNESVRFITVSQSGYGKMTEVVEYKIQKRGGGGIKTFKTTDKTGHLIAVRALTEDYSELIAISRLGQVIRVGLDQVPVQGRQTQGVRLMKLKIKDQLASVTFL